ncbi:MAG: VWA domain-containing protein [Desulfuromonadales bacterium]
MPGHVQQKRNNLPQPGSSWSATCGRRIGNRPWRPGDAPSPIDLGGTLNACMARLAGAAQGAGENKSLTAADLHLQLRGQRPRRLTVFLIDTSDSMGNGPTIRMSAALGAIAALASRAYLNREQVCLITFRDRHAQVVVPPTASVMRIRQQLNRLPIGGATPLAAGLQKAGQVINQARRKDRAVEPLLVLISDGEATTPLHAGADPAQEALEIARQMGQEAVPALVIDTTPGDRQRICMPRIAEALGTKYQHIDNLQAGQVLQLIEMKRPASR